MLHPYMYVLQWGRELPQQKLVRYFLAGGFAGIVNYGFFSLLYLVGGVRYPIATAIAGIGVWMVNFPLHKWWTFRDQGRTKTATSLQTISHGALKLWNNLGAAPLLVIALVEYATIPPMIAHPLAGILLGVFQNYPISRFVIFRRPSK